MLRLRCGKGLSEDAAYKRTYWSSSSKANHFYCILPRKCCNYQLGCPMMLRTGHTALNDWTYSQDSYQLTHPIICQTLIGSLPCPSLHQSKEQILKEPSISSQQEGPHKRRDSRARNLPQTMRSRVSFFHHSNSMTTTFSIYDGFFDKH